MPLSALEAKGAASEAVPAPPVADNVVPVAEVGGLVLGCVQVHLDVTVRTPHEPRGETVIGWSCAARARPSAALKRNFDFRHFFCNN